MLHDIKHFRVMVWQDIERLRDMVWLLDERDQMDADDMLEHPESITAEMVLLLRIDAEHGDDLYGRRGESKRRLAYIAEMAWRASRAYIEGMSWRQLRTR